MAKIGTPIKKGEEEKKSPLGTIGTVGGTIVGGIYGGPSGAAAGGSIGGTIGGGIGQATGADKAGTPDEMGAQGVQTESAIGRRLQSSQTDNFEQLRQSLEALPQAPEEVRKEYAEPLLTAFTIEAKRRQGGTNFNG